VVATSTASTRMASPAMTASPAAMTAAAAMADKLHHRRCIVPFFVEDVEGSQADV
jgi:hypothetical protein